MYIIYGWPLYTAQALLIIGHLSVIVNKGLVGINPYYSHMYFDTFVNIIGIVQAGFSLNDVKQMQLVKNLLIH